MYTGPPSHLINVQPRSLLCNAFFMHEDLRLEVQQRNAIANSIEPPLSAAGGGAHLDVPVELDNYHSLVPLEPAVPKMPAQATMYRATHSTTGVKYCLRRIHGFRLQSTKCMALIDKWKQMQHSNIVQLREVFTTKSCGDNCEYLEELGGWAMMTETPGRTNERTSGEMQ